MTMPPLRRLAANLSRHRLFFILAALSAPLLCHARRLDPKEVTPLLMDGVLFTAPHDSPRFGYIEAGDATTGKRLWRAVIFRVQVDTTFEEDVQWVFIRSLELEKGGLLVTAEDGSIFRLDLMTKEVRQITKGRAELLPPISHK